MQPPKNRKQSLNISTPPLSLHAYNKKEQPIPGWKPGFLKRIGQERIFCYLFVLIIDPSMKLTLVPAAKYYN